MRKPVASLLFLHLMMIVLFAMTFATVKEFQSAEEGRSDSKYPARKEMIKK